MKAKKMQYGGVKKMQKGGSKLISTVRGTSAINTKLNPKKILETGFNYNTELAKKQKADAAAKAAKAAAAKRAAAKVASGKKVKAVVESLIRPKTVIAPRTSVKTPVKVKSYTYSDPGTGVKTAVKTATGKTVSEIWKEKTGTSWSEAKKQGLTDGSMKANLALLAKLKSGSFDKENQPPARMETVKATDMKVSSTGPTELAGVKSPEKKKKGGIIKTKKK